MCKGSLIYTELFYWYIRQITTAMRDDGSEF